MTHDTIIHDKARDKKGTSREKLRQTWKDRDRHRRPLTNRNGQGHTGTDKDIHGQTDRDIQTGTNRDRQGQTEAGTDRDKEG